MSNKTIEDIILQFSTRSMDILYKNFPSSYTLNASKKLLNIEKGTVFLYTGFYLAGHAETDGPIGTYFLYKSLKILGYKPIIVTDLFCKEFFKECETIYLSQNDCSEINLLNLLSDYNPVCHISIERCAKNINGMYRTSSGIDISEYTPALDKLFEVGNKSVPTIAIADGGNEIGMGNFKEFLEKNIKVVPSVVEYDFIIIASVSNCGAYGFIASLEKESKVSLLPNFEAVDTYMDYIISLGAIDGMTLKNEKSVDGKSWELEKKIIEDLRNYI